ncbi:hypothetical protein I4U23_021776 [Adineta vaga]|nr:hypothetical protein I4U23_021776 [Adineta vaga]
MHSDLTTDLSLIRSNLSKRKLDQENVVLLSTGSLNPVHRSHLSNLIRTKEYLEKNCHFNVLGGFLSPSHNEYVRSKLKNQFLDGKLRIELCQNAIEEENQQDWLSVDKAECMASRFISLDGVTLSLKMYLNENIPLEKSIRVIYVAGLDLFNRCHGMNRLRKKPLDGLAVVYRHGEDQSFIQSFLNKTDQNIIFIPFDEKDSKQLMNISSTLIREKLQLNQDCSHLTYHSVLKYFQYKTMDE